jgi:hypothetical protein
MKQATNLMLNAVCLIALPFLVLLWIGLYPIRMAIDLICGEDPYTR